MEEGAAAHRRMAHCSAALGSRLRMAQHDTTERDSMAKHGGLEGEVDKDHDTRTKRWGGEGHGARAVLLASMSAYGAAGGIRSSFCNGLGLRAQRAISLPGTGR